jgi:hypothetical protein
MNDEQDNENNFRQPARALAPGVPSGLTSDNFSSPFARSLFQSTPWQPIDINYAEFDSGRMEQSSACHSLLAALLVHIYLASIATLSA